MERLNVRIAGLVSGTQRLENQRNQLESEKDAAEKTKDQAMQLVKRREMDLQQARTNHTKLNKACRHAAVVAAPRPPPHTPPRAHARTRCDASPRRPFRPVAAHVLLGGDVAGLLAPSVD